MKDIKMRDIPDYGDIMTKEDWLDSVECRCFIDDDGSGELATSDQVSDVYIAPSQAKYFDFPDWCTHIVWYNC